MKTGDEKTPPVAPVSVPAGLTGADADIFQICQEDGRAAAIRHTMQLFGMKEGKATEYVDRLTRYATERPADGGGITSPITASNGITKEQGTLLIILLLIGIGALFFPMLKPAEKWEYRIESPSDYRFSAAMNEYGKEGWELVSARRASSEGSLSYECIFKRRKGWIE
ncbi:DUF4177 domain-containing protein [Geminisphaera colitermitum]|uniref:DUF4177 domain-containing protein n=1 Tax=Geminisphaera colitermitum TaxID=1148786 RepID=UPI000158D57F|nr:DUF4177 domain-containing protein [Geminisphaera colitermitum]